MKEKSEVINRFLKLLCIHFNKIADEYVTSMIQSSMLYLCTFALLESYTTYIFRHYKSIIVKVWGERNERKI